LKGDFVGPTVGVRVGVEVRVAEERGARCQIERGTRRRRVGVQVGRGVLVGVLVAVWRVGVYGL
jgi:hypothetical protein